MKIAFKLHLSITYEAKEKVRQDLEQYRMKLQRDLGRSTVGSTGLCSGFPIELIALVLRHLPEFTSVEKVEAILPTILSRNTIQEGIPHDWSTDTCQKI